MVITRRATMLAGDRSRGAISPASILSEFRNYPNCVHWHTERNNWCHALERDQCLAIVAVQIVELIKSSNKCSKFMRATHCNLQRQNTVYSHEEYVILQHLLLMRLIVDTRWAKGANRLYFTCRT